MIEWVGVPEDSIHLSIDQDYVAFGLESMALSVKQIFFCKFSNQV
jgi:hypothetical protein